MSASAWKNSVNATTRSVEMYLSPSALKSLNSIEGIQPRMMYASFNDNSCTTIVSCYSPSNARDEMYITNFYNELSSLVRHITKYYVLIIGEVMNAQIEKDRNNKFCLHNSSNRNGEYPAQFSLGNRPVCLNSKFQKRKGKLWTYLHK